MSFEPTPPIQPYDGYYKYNRAVAQDYERVRKGEPHWWQEDRFIKSHLKGRTIQRLLDLPVGTGRFFPHYGSVQNLTGVDISEEMLQEARRNLGALMGETSASLVRGDVLDLRFGDGEFDVSIVWRLLHLLPENLLGKAICELCRVTSGEIIVQTYVPIKAPVCRAGKFLTRLVLRSRQLLRVRPDEKRALDDSPQTKPWSHIQAYLHQQPLIDSLFRNQGLSILKSKLIDRYEGSEVRATVYSRR
jgi:ubiquinone/menaquinone biosynthesis C-methylase UbiE